jgi:hypothetical protein
MQTLSRSGSWNEHEERLTLRFVMAKLPEKPVAELWSTLTWTSAQLVRTKNKNLPLAIKEAPKQAGLYRMTWKGAEDWTLVLKTLHVKATLKVADRILEFAERVPPILLTLGKTTDIHGRIAQHFGTNPNNNRVISRLGQLLPKPAYDALLLLILNNIKVEWVVVENWVERCLLEKYGAATFLPILDLEAEH